MDRRRLLTGMGALSIALSANETMAQRTKRDASSTPTSSPDASTLSPDEMLERILELEEENKTLSAENERLKQRINDMSGQKAPSEPEAQPSSPMLQIGETYTGGDWSVTVSGYEISPVITSSYETNTARGVFALVYFTVINEGVGPTTFPYKDLRLSDSNGRSYTVDDNSLFNLLYVLYEVGSQYDEYQPGLPYNVAVAFDIPPTSTGLVFTTSKGVFSFELD